MVDTEAGAVARQILSLISVDHAGTSKYLHRSRPHSSHQLNFELDGRLQLCCSVIRSSKASLQKHRVLGLQYHEALNTKYESGFMNTIRGTP